MKKTIGVLFGGKSTEHEVSIKSANSVLQNIDYDLFLVIPFKIEKNGTITQYRTLKSPPKSIEDLVEFYDFSKEPLFNLKTTVDLIFSLIHGFTGEDGKIQGFCEIADIPYVGCDVESSVICMNKLLTKERVNNHSNIKVVPYVAILKSSWENKKTDFLREITRNIGYPCFVKPTRSGSSIGIFKINKFEELEKSINRAFEYDDTLLIEKAISGRELEIGIIGNEKLVTSDIGEVVFLSDFYDYETKYKNNKAKNILNPELPNHLISEIEKKSKKIFEVLGCRDYARIDFFYEEKTNTLYFNEINTSPGFTDKSMFPLLFSKSKSTKSLLTSIFSERLNKTKNKSRFWEEKLQRNKIY